jgi:phage regulator Rha-like protein
MNKNKLLIALPIILGFAVLSCRPQYADDVVRISKQYADDIAKIAKTYSDDAAKSVKKVTPLTDDALKTTPFAPKQAVNWASRVIKKRYTQEEIKEVTQYGGQKSRTCRYTSPGRLRLVYSTRRTGYLCVSGWESLYRSTQNYKELDQLFSQRHYEITRSILNHIDSYKVFPAEIDQVIQKSINTTKGVTKKSTEVQYNPETRELVIGFASHQRTYNMTNLFFDGVGSAGIMAGLQKYYTLYRPSDFKIK